MGLHPAMIRSALLVLVSVTLCSATCGVGWKEFGGSCYKQFGTPIPINQIDAKKSCVNEGGNLAIITSAAENNFINEQVIDPALEYSWIGIEYNRNDITGDVNINWIDGSPLDFEDWAFYQSWGGSGPHCGQVNRNGIPSKQGWYVIPCNSTSALSYICEMEIPTTTVPTTTTPACPSNAAHFNTIVRGGLNRVWRTYNWLLRYHQYNTVLNAAKNNGQHWEGDVGYYVNHTTYHQLKKCCPKLREMKLMQNKAQPQISHITPYLTWTHPNWFQKANKFYCAPSKNYCGANFQLVEIHKAVGSGEHLDAFIPHSDYERNLVLSNKFPKYKSQIARSICWVWQTPGRY